MKVRLFKISVLAGMLGGTGVFLFFLIIRLFTDTNPLGGVRIVDVLFSIFTLAGAMWYISLTRRPRELHLWEGVSTGTLINIVLSVTSASLFFLYVKFLDKAFIPDYIKDVLVPIIEDRKPYTIQTYGKDAHFRLLNNALKTTAGEIWQDEFLKKIFYGFFLVPLIALIMRKKAHH